MDGRQVVICGRYNALVDGENVVGSAHVSVSSYTTWIVDFGATDHMTGASSLFQSLSSLLGQCHIRVADGSSVPVVGKGTVQAGPLSFHSTLYVPKMSINLLSVKSPTKNQNCSVTFFPSYCVFQDLSTEKVIGRGKEDKRLYIFEVPKAYENQRGQMPITALATSVDEIHLWHARYGHVPLPRLKILFLQKFKNVDSKFWRCQVCELSKHTRVSYPPRAQASHNDTNDDSDDVDVDGGDANNDNNDTNDNNYFFLTSGKDEDDFFFNFCKPRDNDDLVFHSSGKLQ